MQHISMQGDAPSCLVCMPRSAAPVLPCAAPVLFSIQSNQADGFAVCPCLVHEDILTVQLSRNVPPITAISVLHFRLILLWVDPMS